MKALTPLTKSENRYLPEIKNKGVSSTNSHALKILKNAEMRLYLPVSSPGFTIIELSIVLVIIGLVAGSIAIGGDLIKAAQLRSVITDIDHFQTAIATFKLKYDCLPGDCPNATNFWPADVGCPATPPNSIPKTETCNGDGNGMLSNWPADQAYSDNSNYEYFRFWQQLANAGLIAGRYSGTPIDANPESAQAGINVPASKIPGGGYSIYNHMNGSILQPNWFYPSPYLEVFSLGASNPAILDTGHWLPVISGIDALSIDSKVDDGLPGTGKVFTYRTAASHPFTGIDCASSDDPAVAMYITSDARIRCAVWFMFYF